MRKILCYEGVEKIPNQLLGKGAVIFPDKPVVVTFGFSNDIKSLVGRATEFQREDDGSITAEITPLDPESNYALLLKDMSCSIYGKILEGYIDNEVQVVNKLELKSVVLTQDVPW